MMTGLIAAVLLVLSQTGEWQRHFDDAEAALAAGDHAAALHHSERAIDVSVSGAERFNALLLSAEITFDAQDWTAAADRAEQAYEIAASEGGANLDARLVTLDIAHQAHRAMGSSHEADLGRRTASLRAFAALAVAPAPRRECRPRRGESRIAAEDRASLAIWFARNLGYIGGTEQPGFPFQQPSGACLLTLNGSGGEMTVIEGAGGRTYAVIAFDPSTPDAPAFVARSAPILAYAASESLSPEPVMGGVFRDGKFAALTVWTRRPSHQQFADMIDAYSDGRLSPLRTYVLWGNGSSEIELEDRRLRSSSEP
jgi:hypothetical protein